MDIISNTSINEIKNGFSYCKENGIYECLICGARFEEGEIYEFEDRLFIASRAIVQHIKEKHSSILEYLLDLDRKITGITEHQKELIKNIAMGISDNEIAHRMGLATATIRHQRFVFREKAKQAKIFLSIIELMESAKKAPKGDDYVEIHSGAQMVDERYLVTHEEQDKIINTYFFSLDPLKLDELPSKEKRKIVVLRKIVSLFENDKKYTENEINLTLKEVFHDFATIRRYLIEYGFMERTNDCSLYWRKL